MMYSPLIGFVVIFGSAVGLHPPSEFTICKSSEKDRNECIKKAFEDALGKLDNGLPKFNLPPLQPVVIPTMTIGEGTGTVHVVQKYTDMKIYNVIYPKISKLRMNLTEKHFKLEGNSHYKEIILQGEYDFNGKILVLPIVGIGNSTIRLTELDVGIVLTGEIFKKKEKEYIEIKEFKLSLNPNKVEFNFENLFNGDERLGKEVNNLLNDNWEDVFEDIKSGYEEALGIAFQSLANIIFKKIPYREIFPE